MAGQEKDETLTVTDYGHELDAKDDKKGKASTLLYQDQILAKTLQDLGISVEIPVRLYEAAVKVLTFVAALDEKSLNRKP